VQTRRLYRCRAERFCSSPMGATDVNLTVTFSGIVMSLSVAAALVALGATDGSTVEVDPSSAGDEPSPNRPLSFPAHVIRQPQGVQERATSKTYRRENRL
jgi:hypothetical protein